MSRGHEGPSSLGLLVSFALSAYAAHRLSPAAPPARPEPKVAISAGPRPAVAAPQPTRATPETAVPSGPLRYLAIGGGAVPESTEVSLEQNLALAQSVLAGPGSLLFAGGVGTISVRELATSPPQDSLLVRVGELFAPRSGRGSRYRASATPAGEASLDSVEAELVSALAHGSEPLLLYFALHGEQAQSARENAVVLWGGERLTAARLAELHEAHPRPLRVVSAACFSGGFAELAFRAADATRGPAAVPRCGLFAGTWDRETSGCDPDPDRRRQEGYSLHFLNALAGRDRDGRTLAQGELDVDRDGKVSLLEAHVRAAAAARSLDVPTTTSERYLREVQRKPGRAAQDAVPELGALVSQLGAGLGLSSEAEVRARASELQAKLTELDRELNTAEEALDDRFVALSSRLLGRWPVLDDAFHPDFARTLAEDRAAIASALDDWPEAKAFGGAQRALDRLDERYQAVELEEASVQRLVRAYDTLGLAGALAAKGGAKWGQYQALLQCERFVPELSP